MVTDTQTTQTAQRIKVGMTGLAVVLLLMALASAIFRSASKEKPVEVAGAAKPDVVANISITNDNAPVTGSGEPLAELGVAPSAPANSQAAAGNQMIIVPPPVVTQPAEPQPTR
jgi:hypothetical protein